MGVGTGIMDQYASLLCEAGAALLVDCRSLDAQSVPLDLRAAGLALVVCDTRVERGLADTGYNDRRATCERARRCSVSRNCATPRRGDLDLLSGAELKRARHVISENARVLEAVEALRDRDFDEFGRLMYASHASLRDDYEVSTPELDTFVETAQAARCQGARLTGAGFGGCAIALVPEDETDTFTNCLRASLRQEWIRGANVLRVRPCGRGGDRRLAHLQGIDPLRSACIRLRVIGDQKEAEMLKC